MADSLLTFLQTLLDDAAAGLPAVTPKRMFGCYCLFTGGQIFAAVWKEGLINLRLPDPKAYQALLAVEGAKTWSIGKKTMSHWVLAPETFHDDIQELNLWVRKAHQLASKAAKTKPPKKQKLEPRTKRPAQKR